MCGFNPNQPLGKLCDAYKDLQSKRDAAALSSLNEAHYWQLNKELAHRGVDLLKLINNGVK